MISEARPAKDHTPSPGAFTSKTKNTTDAIRSTMPIRRTGSTPKATNDDSKRTVPIVPAKMCPGTISSITISRSPSQKKMNAMFGSSSPCRNPAPGEHRTLFDLQAGEIGDDGRRPVAERHGRPAHRRQERVDVGFDQIDDAIVQAPVPR